MNKTIFKAAGQINEIFNRQKLHQVSITLGNYQK